MTCIKMIFIKMTYYSNRDPVNLSDVFIKVRVASKMNLFLFSSNRGSPNKSKSLNQANER